MTDPTTSAMLAQRDLAVASALRTLETCPCVRFRHDGAERVLARNPSRSLLLTASPDDGRLEIDVRSPGLVRRIVVPDAWHQPHQLPTDADLADYARSVVEAVGAILPHEPSGEDRLRDLALCVIERTASGRGDDRWAVIRGTPLHGPGTVRSLTGDPIDHRRLEPESRAVMTPGEGARMPAGSGHADPELRDEPPILMTIAMPTTRFDLSREDPMTIIRAVSGHRP